MLTIPQLYTLSRILLVTGIGLAALALYLFFHYRLAEGAGRRHRPVKGHATPSKDRKPGRTAEKPEDTAEKETEKEQPVPADDLPEEETDDTEQEKTDELTGQGAETMADNGDDDEDIGDAPTGVLRSATPEGTEDDDPPTGVLAEDGTLETDILTEAGKTDSKDRFWTRPARNVKAAFRIEKEIVIIHTDKTV